MNARPEVLLQFAGQLRHTRQLVLFLSLSFSFFALPTTGQMPTRAPRLFARQLARFAWPAANFRSLA